MMESFYDHGGFAKKAKISQINEVRPKNQVKKAHFKQISQKMESLSI